MSPAWFLCLRQEPAPGMSINILDHYIILKFNHEAILQRTGTKTSRAIIMFHQQQWEELAACLSRFGLGNNQVHVGTAKILKDFSTAPF